MSARMEDTTVEPIQYDAQSTTNAMTSASDSPGGRFFFAFHSLFFHYIVMILLVNTTHINGVIPGIAICSESASGTILQSLISGPSSSEEFSAIS